MLHCINFNVRGTLMGLCFLKMFYFMLFILFYFLCMYVLSFCHCNYHYYHNYNYWYYSNYHYYYYNYHSYCYKYYFYCFHILVLFSNGVFVIIIYHYYHYYHHYYPIQRTNEPFWHLLEWVSMAKHVCIVRLLLTHKMGYIADMVYITYDMD